MKSEKINIPKSEGPTEPLVPKFYGADYKLSDDISEGTTTKITSSSLFPELIKTYNASNYYINDINQLLSQDTSPYTIDQLKLIQKVYSNKHIEFINYICDYINDIQFTQNEINENKYIIVGDVHGSILQLLMPLKEAGIITSVNLTRNKEFNITTVSDSDLSNSKQVIYCGDFVGRAKHPLTVELLLSFIDIYNKVNYIVHDKIVWVFGNHDVGFIRKFVLGLPSLTHVFCSEYDEIINSEKLPKLKTELYNLACKNKYPCIYYLENDKSTNSKNIMVSHTILSVNEHENRNTKIKWFGLNVLYYLFNKLELKQYIKEIINKKCDFKDLFNKLNLKYDGNCSDSIHELYELYKPSIFDNLAGGMKRLKRSRSIMNFDKKEEFKLFVKSDEITSEDIYNNVIKEFIKLKESKQKITMFDDLDDIKLKIKFINKLAKYYVIFNPLPCYSDIEMELYWSRFDDDKFQRYEIFKEDDVLYFIGHTPNQIITKLISDLEYINKTVNKINIPNIEIKNKTHLKYINEMKDENNDVDEMKDENIKEYNENIIKYTENIAKIIQLINEKFEDNKYLSDTIGLTEYGKPYCLIDFYVTSGISTNIHIDRMTSSEVKNMMDYINYDENKMKTLKSIEIGYNMGLYVKVDNDYKIKLSKLYIV